MLLDSSRLVGRFFKGRAATGIDRVCLAYQRRYANTARALVGAGNTQLQLSGKMSMALFEVLERFAQTRSPEPGRVGRAVRAGHLAMELGKPSRHVPQHGKDAEAGHARVVLNVGHTGLHNPRYARWLASQRHHAVFMIHDLIPLTHPEFSRAGESEKHALRIRTALRHGAGLILNSAATLDSLTEYANGFSLPMPPSVVAPLGIEPQFLKPDPRSRLSIQGGPRPYFLMLGTIEARKNHWMILQVWRRLVTQLGDRAPRLVIIGQRGWEAESAIDMLDRCPLIAPHVTEINRCNDHDLAQWISGACALLFPSFAEGYGLPLLEALAMGTPVIASDLPVFREMAGGHIQLNDPLDAMGWMSSILEQARRSDLNVDDSARNTRPSLAGFTVPDWSSHFEIVDDFLARLGRPGRGSGFQRQSVT